jgi:hypothetical protein
MTGMEVTWWNTIGILIPIFLMPIVVILITVWKIFLEPKNKILVKLVDSKGDEKRYKITPSPEGWVKVGKGEYKLNPEYFYRSGFFGQWKTALCVAGANTNLNPYKPIKTGRKLRYTEEGEEREVEEAGEELKRDFLSPEEIADSRVIPLTVREIYFGKVMSFTSIITLVLALIVVGVSFYNANTAKNYGDYIQESNEKIIEKIEDLLTPKVVEANETSGTCVCCALPTHICGLLETCSPACLTNMLSLGKGLSVRETTPQVVEEPKEFEIPEITSEEDWWQEGNITES